jgi:hypothetical protein
VKIYVFQMVILFLYVSSQCLWIHSRQTTDCATKGLTIHAMQRWHTHTFTAPLAAADMGSQGGGIGLSQITDNSTKRFP